MQALLNGAGLRLVGKWSQLNTPHRAVLHDPAWHRELLAQTLLILLRPRLVAHCAHLDDKVTAGAGGGGRGSGNGAGGCGRCGRDATLDGAGGGHRRCWRGAGGRCGHGGGRGFAALQHAAVQRRRGAEETAAVHRSANAIFRLQRAVADRANVSGRRLVHASGVTAVQIRTGGQSVSLFGDGGTSHSRAGKRTVRRDDDGVDTHFGVVRGVQAVGGRARERDNPIVAVGTAIVNPHDDHAPVGEVGDPRIARDRQRRVRRGQLRRVEGFTAGGQVAVGFRVIDRRETGLSKVCRILDDFVALTVALIILIRRRVRRFILRIGAADLNRRAITDGRLWSTDRFLLHVITRTCRQQPRCYADPQPLLTHC